MSSFFQRMAERALGTAPVVRPLVPPRYASPELGAPASPLLEEVQPAARAQALPERPVAPGAVPAPPGVAPAPPGAVEIEVETGRPEVELVPSATARQVSVHAEAPVPSPPALSGPAAPPRGEAPMSVPVPPGQVQHSLTSAQLSAPATPAPTPPAPSHEPLELRPPAARADTLLPSAVAAPAPRIHSEATEPLLLPELDAPEPLVPAPRGASPALAPPPSTSASPSGERTVRITIGRIDVHAAPPAPAPRAQPAERKPPLSLEEYLARRQRGPR